jgi:linoleate 10R-lipoxygenase
VGNLAHCHFAANVFSLPMKSKENPRGIFSEHELYSIVALIFTCIFFDFEPSKSFSLRLAAKSLGQKLGSLIEGNVETTSATGFASTFVDGFRENQNALKSYGIHMVRSLLESGLGVHEVTWSQILPVAVAMIPNQSQVFTQMLDFYLTPENAHHWAEIQRIAHGPESQKQDELLMHYVVEGIRLQGTFGSYRESRVNTIINDGDKQVPVRVGDKIFCSFVSANRDPVQFPNPNEVCIDRPLDSYIHYGIGPHKCLGMEASRVGMEAMLKTVAKLKGLRRAPGPQGQLKKVPRQDGFYV